MAIDPVIKELMELSKSPLLDYGLMMHVLREYQDPRGKLHRLIQEGSLVQVKKGVYVLGRPFARVPCSKEVIANVIYGPSYVSLEWACQYYGLIPERVQIVTSVTTRRSKAFDTPLGRFTFTHLHPALYPEGITQVDFGNQQKGLIATKEKALADLVVLRRRRCTSLKQMQEILFEDLRIEGEDLLQFDLERLQKFQATKPHSAVHYLIAAIEKEKSA